MGVLDKLADALDRLADKPTEKELREAEINFLESQKTLNEAQNRVLAALTTPGVHPDEARLLDLEEKEARETRDRSEKAFQELTTPSSGWFSGLQKALLGDTVKGEGVRSTINTTVSGFQNMLEGVKEQRIGAALGGAAAGTTNVIAGAGMATSVLAGAPELAPLIGIVARYVGDFEKAVLGSVDALRDWARGLHNSNIQFAEFSSAMAAVQIQQEVRDIFTSIERGNRRAEMAEKAAQAMTHIERGIAPYEDALADLEGWLEVNFLAPLFSDEGGLGAITAWLRAQGVLPPAAPPDETLKKWLEEAGDPIKNNLRAPQRFRP